MSYFKLMTLLFAIGLFTSCQQKVEEVPVPVGDDLRRSTDTLQTIFPHSQEFMKTQKHGAYYIKDRKLCQSCHVPTVTENDVKKEEFCLSCHKVYPHDGDFTKTFKHGQQFLKDKSQCLSCHQNQRMQTTKISKNCIECHQYPHAPGWVAKSHTEQYWKGKTNEKLKVNCTHCHNDDGDFHQRNPKNFQSCNSCHMQVPHDFGSFFSHTSASGPYQMNDKKHCTQCHNPLNKYHQEDGPFPSDPAQMNCTSCHSGVSTNHHESKKLQKNYMKQWNRKKRSISSEHPSFDAKPRPKHPLQ